MLDIGAFLAGTPSARETGEQVARTCEDTGFLVIANHGIDQALIDGAFAAASDFFDLEMARKLALKVGDLNIGYLPYGAQIVRTSKVNHNTKPNLSESFYIVTDRAAGRSGDPGRQSAVWPEPLAAGDAGVQGRDPGVFQGDASARPPHGLRHRQRAGPAA